MTSLPPLLMLESPEIRALIRALGANTPPSRITQQPLDFDPSHYARLCDRERPASARDLATYADDLLYCPPIQTSLLVYLLPTLLHHWRRCLLAPRYSDFAAFLERFNTALARNAGFRELLVPRHHEAVGRFMSESLLQRIGQEFQLHFESAHASPYTWVSALATFGKAFPLVAPVWSQWWGSPSEGHARAVLQYLSVLMYGDTENPVFAPWSPEQGGGPPLPWEDDSFADEACWLPENVDFLHSTLTTEYARHSLLTACARLEGKDESGVPQKMRGDFEAARPRLERRVEALLQRLSSPQEFAVGWADP